MSSADSVPLHTREPRSVEGRPAGWGEWRQASGGDMRAAAACSGMAAAAAASLCMSAHLGSCTRHTALWSSLEAERRSPRRARRVAANLRVRRPWHRGTRVFYRVSSWAPIVEQGSLGEPPKSESQDPRLTSRSHFAFHALLAGFEGVPECSGQWCGGDRPGSHSPAFVHETLGGRRRPEGHWAIGVSLSVQMLHRDGSLHTQHGLGVQPPPAVWAWPVPCQRLPAQHLHTTWRAAPGPSKALAQAQPVPAGRCRWRSWRRGATGSRRLGGRGATCAARARSAAGASAA